MVPFVRTKKEGTASAASLPMRNLLNIQSWDKL